MSTATLTKSQRTDRLYLTGVPAYAPIFEMAHDPSVRHFFLWGGRGGGKSSAMADFFSLQGRTETGVYLCTREVQNSLSDSVIGSIRNAIEDIGIPGYYITDSGIDHSRGVKMAFHGLGYRNGVHVKSTSGIIRAWVEEAQQISSESLKVLIPTVRRPGSKLYYTFNRTAPRDPIWEYWQSFKTQAQIATCSMGGCMLRWKIHRGDGALGIEINYDGNPYFPDALESDRERDYRNALESGDWGNYNHVWMGQPEAQGRDSIITLRQAMEAAKREVSDEGAVEVGADIARGGKDRVVFYRRKGLRVLGKQIYANNAKGEKMRITETAERLMAFAGSKEVLIKVDDTGLGGGVTDILEDNGYRVAAVIFGARARDSDHYTNVASELWFDFAQIVDEVSIPDDIGLIEEIVERREGRRDKQGRRTVESKDDFIERVGRSPDEADALLLCFYEPANIVTSVGWSLA